MTVRVYRSTDVGAPALSAAAGSLIGVLDAILVNGYGSGGGARAPLGWTKEFSGVNLGAYRNASNSVARSFFYVNDVNATAAKIVGFESMTAIEVGTGMWPDYPSAPSSGTSATMSAIALPMVFKGAAWLAFGDETCLHFFCGPTAATMQGHYLGDIENLINGNVFGSIIIGATKRPAPGSNANAAPNNNQFSVISRNGSAGYAVLSAFNSNTTQTDSAPTFSYPYGAVKDNFTAFDILRAPSAQVTAASYNRFCLGNAQVMRHPTHKVAGGCNIYLQNESSAPAVSPGAQSALNGASVATAQNNYTIFPGSSTMPMPYPLEGGGLMLERYKVCTDGVAPFYDIGYLKGVWQPTVDISSIPHGDTFTGSGALAGKTFEVVKLATGVNCCIETSNTW